MDLFIRESDAQSVVVHVNIDDVAIFQQANHAPLGRFGRDMSDTRSPRRTGKSSVGDQGHFLAQSHSRDQGGGGEHLLHTGTASGPFITDYDDISCFHFSAGDADDRLLLGVEAHGRAAEGSHIGIDTCSLDDRTLCREIAVENRKSAHFGVGIVDRVDDIFVFDFGIRDTLSDRLSLDRGIVEFKDIIASFGDLMHHRAHAAGSVDILHMDRGEGGGYFGDMADALAHLVDIREVEIHTRFVGDRKHMQYGIGAASHRHIDGKGIVDRLFVQNIFDFELFAHRFVFGDFTDASGRLSEQCFTLRCESQDRTVAFESDTHRLHQRVHGVGREHTAAASAARTCRTFNLDQFFLIDLSRFILPDRFKCRGQIDRCAVGKVSRTHRSAADKKGRNIDPECSHNHTRRDLVAVGDTDHRVEFVGVHDRFDRIGDDFAAGERVEHSVVPHCDTVIHTDGVELKRYTAALSDLLLDDRGIFVQKKMSGNNFDKGVGDADKRFVEIFIFESRRAKEASVGCSLIPFFDLITSHNRAFMVKFLGYYSEDWFRFT